MAWFSLKGFGCERTRKNLYGYPGLFRELLGGPPWAEIEQEDCEGVLSPERAAEVESLYRQIATRKNILSTFENHLYEKDRESELWQRELDLVRRLIPAEIRTEMRAAKVDDFRRLVRIGEIIAPVVMERLFEAVFD